MPGATPQPAKTSPGRVGNVGASQDSANTPGAVCVTVRLLTFTDFSSDTTSWVGLLAAAKELSAETPSVEVGPAPRFVDAQIVTDCTSSSMTTTSPTSLLTL